MKKMPRILIVVGLVVYCLAFQGARGLWQPDEGRYTAVAMEMLRLGDWISPHLHWEEPHWTKPPFAYWAIASSVSAFGHNEFAARLPSALSFLFTTCLVYLLGRIFLLRRAWMAPLVYASFVFPSVASNIISTDGLLTFWETAAMCAYAYAAWGEDRRTRSDWMLIMWVAFGLAFMTKGPPGLLPFAAIAIHRLWSGRDSGLPPLRWLPGTAILLAVGMSWFAVVVIQNSELVRYFFLHEVYGRVVTGEHGRNSEWYKSITLYLPVLILGTLPWTFWLVRYLVNSVGILRHPRKEQMNSIQRQDLFLLLWLFVPLLIFMVSSSRLPLYVLPLFVPLALLASRGLEAASFDWGRRWRVGIVVWCLLLVASRIIIAKIPTDKDASVLAQTIGACTTNPYTEIAFYNARPVYGLSFYLNKEIEDVELDDLDDEVEEAADETILWMMRPRDAGDFVDYMLKHGIYLKEVCKVDKRYLLYQQDDASKK